MVETAAPRKASLLELVGVRQEMEVLLFSRLNGWTPTEALRYEDLAGREEQLLGSPHTTTSGDSPES